MRYTTLCLLLLFFAFRATGQVSILAADKELHTLESSLMFWEDQTRRATLDDVLSAEVQQAFTKAESSKLNFGYNTTSAFWVKFTLKDLTEGKANWLLEADYAPLDSLTLYQPLGNNEWKAITTGELFPFSSRPVLTRVFAFPLQFPEAESTFYLRVWTTGSVQIPLSVQKQSFFHLQEVRIDILYGILYGIILIMAVYNLAIGYYLQDYSYLVYGISVLMTTLFLMVWRGHAQQYLWPEFPELSNVIIGFSTYMSFGLYVFFSILFLQTHKNYPLMHRISVGFSVALGIMSIVSLFVSYGHTAKISAMMGLIVPFVLMINGGIAWYRGRTEARFFVSAWSFYVLGVLISAMVMVGLIPNTFYTINAAQFGLVIEVVLLSLALADRINIYRSRNEQLVREQNTMLEQKVAERTVALREKQQEVLAQNEELQQQSEEIRAHRDAIQEQHQALEESTRQLQASIRAAKVIQDAILHEPFQHLKDFFKDSALIYVPKDVVSGDFFWAYPTENGILVAAVDCTGHGVPGAFMSMIGHTLLDKIVIAERTVAPELILSQLDQEIRHLLPQDVTGNTTGMDLSILHIEQTETAGEYKVEVSSARSPIFYYSQRKQELIRLRGDHFSIGQRRKRKFEVETIDFSVRNLTLYSGDILYIGSDGLIDQNSPSRERFGTKRLLDITEKLAPLPLEEQRKELRKTINAFCGREPLRDDVLWVGMRLP